VRRMTTDELELELRCLPGVLNVGTAGTDGEQKVVTVCAAAMHVDDVNAEALVIVGLYDADVSVTVVPLPDEGHAPPTLVDPKQVSLGGAEFDPGDGSSRVRVSCGDRLGVGTATSGPLIGGAEATLAAIRDLGVEVACYLLDVTRVDSSPASPVVVTLRATSGGEDRVGVARGRTDVEAAAGATLDAFGRNGHP